MKFGLTMPWKSDPLGNSRWTVSVAYLSEGFDTFRNLRDPTSSVVFFLPSYEIAFVLLLLLACIVAVKIGLAMP